MDTNHSDVDDPNDVETVLTKLKIGPPAPGDEEAGKLEDIILLVPWKKGSWSVYFLPVLDRDRMRKIKRLVTDKHRGDKYARIIKKICFYNASEERINHLLRKICANRATKNKIKATLPSLEVIAENHRRFLYGEGNLTGQIVTRVGNLNLEHLHDHSEGNFGPLTPKEEDIRGYWIDLRQFRNLRVEVEEDDIGAVDRDRNLPDWSDPKKESLPVPNNLYIVAYHDTSRRKRAASAYALTPKNYTRILDDLQCTSSTYLDNTGNQNNDFREDYKIAFVRHLHGAFVKAGTQSAAYSNYELRVTTGGSEESMLACLCYIINLTSFR